jgi:MFS family permease
MFPALSLDMICVLFGGVTALLPIYATDILDVGAKGLGVLRAAPAIGATAMALILARWDMKENAGKWLIRAVAGFGVCILVFSVSKSFLLSVCALALSGFFDGLSMIIRTSIVQLSSPDHMRGRISSVNSIFIGSSNELGEMESGIAARILGTVPAAVFGSIVCLLTVGVVAKYSKSLRELDLNKLTS